MSTIVAELVSLSSAGIKVVLFDLMSEYHLLLTDLLHQLHTAFLLALDTESVPGSADTASYLASGGDATKAAESIVRTMLLPTEFERHRRKFTVCLKSKSW